PDERASASHSRSQSTTAVPALTTASFSAAICSRVSPSCWVWSRPTFVSTTTGARSTLVASSRPPSPASTTATSTRCSANSASAAAVSTSNCVASSGSAAARTRATARSNPAASVSSRSHQPATCGEVYAPTRSPAPRSRAAVSRVVVDLPFVPTTWIDGKASCGSPSSARSARIRSSPNSSGHGESAATQSVAADGVELTAVPRELLPLGLDDLRRRVRDEAVVRQHPLGAGDLLAKPLALGLDVAVRPLALRLDDDVEDPFLVPLERDEHAASPEDRRRLLDALQRARGRLVACLRPRRYDQPRAPHRQVRPDLHGHVRHHRVQQLQQPLEGCERGRPRIPVAVVQPRLDRLRVPVAEVVEGEVVQELRDLREVERGERCFHLPLRERQAREDPALLERGRPLLHLLAGSGQQQAGRVPELVRELPAFLERPVREADVLGGGHLDQPVAAGVGAVTLDHLARVPSRAGALRPPPPVPREHGRVDDHVAERHLAEQLEPGEDHPVLPEADDVARSRLQVARIERPQRRRLVRPPERRERP